MKSVDTPGTLVGGRYRLVKLAGQGGMAEVWRADIEGAEGFRRPVAVKRILRHLVDSPDHRAMFIDEARLTALLDHPNVVQIYDFGEDPQGLFIAMEWIEGLSLKDLSSLCTAVGVLPSPALAAAVGIEVLRGLGAAHDNVLINDDGTVKPAPIIHRDVSPSNVLLSVRGVVKLADFGLARTLHRVGMRGLTPAGVVKGKLAYLAPEVIQGKPATPSADIYGVGVVLWETLCGRRLWQGRSDYDIVMGLVKGERAPLVLAHRPDTPMALAAAVDRALSVNPAERYASAVDFARALSDVLRTVPERTDTTRMSREILAAMAAWRDLQRRAAAGEEIENLDSQAIYIDFTGSALVSPAQIVKQGGAASGAKPPPPPPPGAKK